MPHIPSAMRASSKLISPAHPSLNLRHPTLESFIWNTAIRAHVQAMTRPLATTHSPLSIFLRMRFHGVRPDLHTFPFLLQYFSSPSRLHLGSQIHGQAFLFGLDVDPFVQTSLINMYSSCGSLTLANLIFMEISRPDIPSWNSIIHANLKAGLIEGARQLFDVMPERNVVSWSCMINGYAKGGEYKKALSLFREMQEMEENNVEPNGFTMSSVLSACGRLGALEHGKWVHAYIEKCGMKINNVLGTSLVDMYAKCGNIERAEWVFDRLGDDKDVMAWSAMMAGLAMHGNGRECLLLFEKMTEAGVRPNGVTLLAVLSACVHGGLVREGEEYFEKMSREFGIVPEIQHYGCLVDLYSRAGLIEEAQNVAKNMPVQPDVLIWGALLSGAKTHGDIKTCETALVKMIEMDHTNSSAYILLSNIYAKAGQWNEVRRVRNLMALNVVQKVPGCSLVEIEGKLHEFFAGDNSHPEYPKIYKMLEEIMKKIKVKGFVGNTKEILLDLDEEGRELALSYHSEKLAIAFCLLKTLPGTPIRIIKNLRICGDCHEAFKMISSTFERAIVVRDCNRFHHFRDGSCSCKGYW